MHTAVTCTEHRVGRALSLPIRSATYCHDAARAHKRDRAKFAVAEQVTTPISHTATELTYAVACACMTAGVGHACQVRPRMLHASRRHEITGCDLAQPTTSRLSAQHVEADISSGARRMRCTTCPFVLPRCAAKPCPSCYLKGSARPGNT